MATDVQTPTFRERMRRWVSRLLVLGTWVYLGLLIAAWAVIHFCGDSWWLPTMILFGPRWCFALPFAAFVPFALLKRRRLLGLLAVEAVIVFGPLMGFCFSWGRFEAAEGPSLRVLTCNVKGKCFDNPALDDLIAQSEPDVVALQGCWLDVRIRWPKGWRVYRKGEFLVASRFPLAIREKEHTWDAPGPWPLMDMVYCVVQTPDRDVDLFCLHLTGLHQGISGILDRQTLLRPSKGAALEAAVGKQSRQSADAEPWARGLSSEPIFAGDFNMTADSSAYRQSWDKYRNAFSEAGLGYGYTEWPRVRGATWGIRIDHLLTGPGWRCRRCWVGPDIGSDHLPLLADFVLLPAGS
jgi:endonuclease/exonuclease/phosphatase (EEP) superfamily protein YafD